MFGLLEIVETNKQNSSIQTNSPKNKRTSGGMDLHSAELTGNVDGPKEPLMGWQTSLELQEQIPKSHKDSLTPPLITTAPRFVHFIFGLDTSGEHPPEFGFIQYLSIVSAYVSLRPERIFFWHYIEPTGDWWKKTRPFITDVRIARAVTEIFGNPIDNYAHKADILRLEILLKYGGIYLDQDTVIWRNMDSLLEHECVMGHEGEGAWVGLGNAVIIAKPGSRFIRR